ncbi:hypothetical protein OJAV_G00181120 [Oryzias javanicus]|uniref:Uncharacterized protein n=1 Tax=Oryzias javanicus TaxID=123683 RepID=A0A3S2MIX2_ORYJA|nr:hypothetical protein OJAV_G00181120 [Oryzias javanicus]
MTLEGSTTAFLLFYRKKDSSLRVLKANKNGRPAVRDNHDPIPGDKTYNQNDEEINSEDETLSISRKSHHQKIHISDDFDSVGNKLTRSCQDVRRHSNRYLLVDGVISPAGKKHKEDETLTKAKESETKQKKFDVRVTSEEVKRLHDGKQEDDLEQRSKSDKVMISELQIKLQSMAANGNNAPNPADLDANSVEQQGENSMESKGISLDLNNIKSFTRKREQNKPSNTRRFRNQKHKLDLLKQKKKLKGTDVYYHLTRKKPEMIRKARFLKKQKRIRNTWVRNQKISIKVNRAQEQTTVRNVNMEDSEKCLGTLV